MGSTAINGTGNDLANKIVGNGATNTLVGMGGDDLLDGGSGSDVLKGHGGNDTYVVDSAGDQVGEASAAGGTDSVRRWVDYALGANLENLTLLGAAQLNGTGNGLANMLVGNGGANRLDGGAGADTLSGGNGNDTYTVDQAGDTVIEGSTNGGIDTVRSFVDMTLGANLDNLILIGSAVSGIGNALDNQLTGTEGANILDGAAGEDMMYGLGGNDTLSGGAGVDHLDGGAGNDI